ncbi:hypothetical protein ABIE40_005663 [Rhizobium sp. OAE497]
MSGANPAELLGAFADWHRHVTAFVTSLDLDVERFSSALPHELDKPSRTTYPFHGQRRGRQPRDSPPCTCRGRIADIGNLGVAPPPPNDQTQHSLLLGRELKAPGDIHWKTTNFGHDGAQTSVSERFLERFLHGEVVRALYEHEPVRRQSDARERRCEQVGSREAPHHRTGRPCRYSRDELGRRRSPHRVVSASTHLMYRAVGEAPVRKSSIDVRKTERQRSTRPFAPPSVWPMTSRRWAIVSAVAREGTVVSPDN